MYMPLFNEFLLSADTLQAYKEDKLLFSPNKDRLLPLLEYIDSFVPYRHQKDNGQDMCPVERSSVNKEPEEFYEVVKDIIK